MKLSTEAKVGIFSLVAIIAFAILIVQLSDLVFFGKPGYEIYGYFKEANGLNKGHLIRYSGVEVGRIDGVRALDNEVEVKMRIYNDTHIPVDSRFSIESEGIMAERFVNIIPGNMTAGVLQPNARIYGSPPGGIDAVVRETQKLIAISQETLDEVNALVKDPEMQESLRTTIQNAELLSNQMLALTATVQNMANQMEVMLYRLDGDGQTTENIRAIAANVRETSENAKYMSERVRKMTDDLHMPGSIDLLYNTDKSDYTLNANFKIGSREQFAVIGAEHIGDGTKANLQYARSNGTWTGRAGLIRSKPGVGADYTKEKWQLLADMYDFNDVKYRIRGQWSFTPDWYVVGQSIFPHSSEYGGNYFGINHTF